MDHRRTELGSVNKNPDYLESKFILLTLLALTPLFLTGCASEEPRYDPVDLIEYENCLKNPPEYFGGVFTPPRNWAEQACEDKRPVLE
jgi:hypothetical protein